MFEHLFLAMTTRCSLQFWGVDAALAQRVSLRVEARVKALEKRYNFHASSSWLNTAINQRRSPVVQLDTETADVLAVVHAHSVLTQGAFDITVGTCHAHLKKANTQLQVAQVRQRCAPWMDLAHWRLEGNSLHFDNPHTRFDLGGVIKEHAVDVAAHMALDAGITRGLINFGGDVYALGCKPDGTRFVAGTPNPLTPQQLLFGLDLQDQALTTSAHYARARRLADGSALSHVLQDDAAPQHWLSASVVSHSALVSGIYSTALLVRADTLLPSGAVAVVVDAQGAVHSYSSNRNVNCSEALCA
jgi:FAD:protein FMN transferase